MRYAEVFLGILVFGALLFGILWITISTTRDQMANRRTRKDNEKERKLQQELAGVAPAVLRGDPLLPIVISQGKQLQAANNLLNSLQADELKVFMPTEMKERISIWQTQYNQGELQS